MVIFSHMPLANLLKSHNCDNITVHNLMDPTGHIALSLHACNVSL